MFDLNQHNLMMKSPFLMADVSTFPESPFTPMASGREAESSEKLPDGQEGDESLGSNGESNMVSLRNITKHLSKAMV